MTNGSQSLKLLLNQVTPVEEDAWNDFESFFSTKSLSKYENLWIQGDFCKHLVFVNHGLIRSYINSQEKEITNHLYFENSLFSDDYSFINQQPTTNNYEALEKTELILIPRAALYLMYDKYKSFERLGRMMVESIHVKLLEAQQKVNYSSAHENYKALMDNAPHIIKRVPQKIIASYLNITPEHLSRIRKDMSN